MKFLEWSRYSYSRILMGIISATLFATIDLQAAHDPQIVHNSTGSAVTAWCQPLPGGKKIIQVSNYSQPLGAWSLPTRLSNPDFDSIKPQVGIDANGNAVCVWITMNKKQGMGKLNAAMFSPLTGNWVKAIPSLSKINESVCQCSLHVDSATGNISIAYTALEPNSDSEGVYSLTGSLTNGTWSTSQKIASTPLNNKPKPTKLP